MTNVLLQLPDELEPSLDLQMRAAGFSDLASYVQALLKADRKRLAQLDLEAKLREGFESETFYEADEEFFRGLRDELDRTEGLGSAKSSE